MTTKHLALVTGANGHLGNNLVRHLIQQGIPVRASVRHLKNKETCEDLGCEIVQADITDKNSLLKALAGVEVFYAVGAAFKLWAKDPKKEIYDVNLLGTRNILEAAKEAGVRRIVYVSSIAALNYSSLPTNESKGYNPDRRDWYYNSKNDGEKLAFTLAKAYGIELVSVLPGAMIGSVVHEPLSVSYNIIDLILKKEIPIETNITLNWIDVKDVAEGCYLSATKGRNGERYILANETCTSIRETTGIARSLFPEKNIKLQRRVPKPLLYGLAGLMELGSKLSGKAPLLSVKDIAMFSGLQQNFDTSKARSELGFSPKSSYQAVKEAMLFLENKKHASVKPRRKTFALFMVFMSLFALSFSQNNAAKNAISLETDPAFWVGTLANGAAFDANIDFKLHKTPGFRFGLLVSTGKWGGSFGKRLLLTNDFPEDNWITTWNAIGTEIQYQIPLGSGRGSLQPGIRMQWNQFLFYQNTSRKGEANQFAITPQLGFQYFPFRKFGLYLLPWAGVQIPVAGTDKRMINANERATRKMITVVTAHIGWEFKF